MFKNVYSENSTVCEIMSKNVVDTEGATNDVTIWHMGVACWITMTTNTHSEYLIISALSQQQWLCERASNFHYTYTDCLVFLIRKFYIFLQPENSGISPCIYVSHLTTSETQILNANFSGLQSLRNTPNSRKIKLKKMPTAVIFLAKSFHWMVIFCF